MLEHEVLLSETADKAMSAEGVALKDVLTARLYSQICQLQCHFSSTYADQGIETVKRTYPRDSPSLLRSVQCKSTRHSILHPRYDVSHLCSNSERLAPWEPRTVTGGTSWLLDSSPHKGCISSAGTPSQKSSVRIQYEIRVP